MNLQNLCPICGLVVDDACLFFVWTGPTLPGVSVRIHSNNGPTETCQDRLVRALAERRVSLDGSRDGSKAATLGRALDAVEKHPALADRILALAERALS